MLVNPVVIWDNRRTMHAATELSDGPEGSGSRVMWRVTIADDEDAAGIANQSARL